MELTSGNHKVWSRPKGSLQSVFMHSDESQ